MATFVVNSVFDGKRTRRRIEKFYDGSFLRDFSLLYPFHFHSRLRRHFCCAQVIVCSVTIGTYINKQHT